MLGQREFSSFTHFDLDLPIICSNKNLQGLLDSTGKYELEQPLFHCTYYSMVVNSTEIFCLPSFDLVLFHLKFNAQEDELIFITKTIMWEFYSFHLVPDIQNDRSYKRVEP